MDEAGAERQRARTATMAMEMGRAAMIRITESDAAPDALRRAFMYQPFELPDGTITGAGLQMVKATPHRALRPGEVDDDVFEEFRAGAVEQEAMYEEFLAALAGEVPVVGASYLDVACNAGYFCYRMLQMGAASATGIDFHDQGVAFRAANRSLGLDARFVTAAYDMQAHRVPGLTERFDVVSCIAFMCHSSDPTYLLAYLASLARKAVMVYSKFPASKDLTIRYAQPTSRYFGGTFPTCFDSATEMSEPLLRTGLEQLGFRVVEVERRATWKPASPQWRCFIGVRE